MAEPSLPPALRSLLLAGSKLARSTTSGRVAYAHAHALVDPEGLPPVVRDRIMAELSAAAAEVTPLDAKAVSKALKDAWGRDHGKVVDDLDPGSPLAVTPGAQTHRARLDGDDVVVKILRPGLRDAVRSDLGLLETLAAPARAAFPAVDAGVMIREVRERILDELDLEHEAATQRTVSRALRRSAHATVPAPVTDLCEEGVLVSAYVGGPTLADGMPAHADAAAICVALVRTVVGLARTTGLVHADPSPDNVIVTGPDSIALVDLGASARVDATRLDGAMAAVQALRDGDEATFAAAVTGLGLLPDAESCGRAYAIARAAGGDLLTGPAVLDAAALRALGERADAHADELFALALKGSLDPADLWPLRAIGTLIATLGRFGAEADWIAVALEAARDGV